MAKKSYFGTDGVRGRANSGKMTPDMVMRLGMAAGKHFRNGGTRRHSLAI
jgi:phosphoglucosamine mutase